MNAVDSQNCVDCDFDLNFLSQKKNQKGKGKMIESKKKWKFIQGNLWRKSNNKFPLVVFYTKLEINISSFFLFFPVTAYWHTSLEKKSKLNCRGSWKMYPVQYLWFSLRAFSTLVWLYKAAVQTNRNNCLINRIDVKVQRSKILIHFFGNRYRRTGNSCWIIWIGMRWWIRKVL